jgi:hypothetical protein
MGSKEEDYLAPDSSFDDAVRVCAHCCAALLIRAFVHKHTQPPLPPSRLPQHDFVRAVPSSGRRSPEQGFRRMCPTMCSHALPAH